AAYAKAGANVILVDADLRRPSLHYWLGRNRLDGITDYVIQPQMVLFDIILETPLERLSIIPAGTQVVNSSEVLVMERFDALLAELKRRYDMVIIDTAPVLAAIDAKVVASKCDGVVFVVESKAKREEAKKALDELKEA